MALQNLQTNPHQPHVANHDHWLNVKGRVCRLAGVEYQTLQQWIIRLLNKNIYADVVE